jgi:addiction module HigA family antidote
MGEDRLPPVHPGEILRLDFLEPLGISQYALAKAIGVPPQRILEIVHGRRAVTADTALRLGRYFGDQPQLWLNLQTRYDVDHAEDALGDRLEREVTPRAAQYAPLRADAPPRMVNSR